MRLVKNPFSTAQPVSKKLKICFFGPSGSGKTVSALTFPRVALIDAEGGSDMYAGRPGIAPFSILRTKSIQELREAISYIRTDNGRSFDTLVIDPITVFYDVQKEALSRASRTGDMTVREWTRVNGAMKAVYAELYQLPVHVVVIAREALPLFFDPRMVAPQTSYSPSSQKPVQVVASWRALGIPLVDHGVAPVTIDEFAGAHDRDFVEGVLALRISNGFGDRDPRVAVTAARVGTRQPDGDASWMAARRRPSGAGLATSTCAPKSWCATPPCGPWSRWAAPSARPRPTSRACGMWTT